MDTQRKLQEPYIYDTPTGIIQKEGQFFRGIGTHDANRSIFVRSMAIFFSLFMFVLPGFFVPFFIVSVALGETDPSPFWFILPVIFGGLWMSAGILVIYQNVRK